MKKILWLLLLVSLSVSAQTKMGPIVVQSITVVNGTIMTGSVTFSSLAGGGTQCLQINNAGVISGTGSACGGGGGGGVTGPGSSIVGDVVIWGNTAGNVVADGGFPPGDVRTTAPNVYDAGVRNWFESDATNAGINIRSTASALPPTVLNGGDLYVVASTDTNCRMTGKTGGSTGNMPLGFAVNSFGTVECFAALSDFGQSSGIGSTATILHFMPRAILPENVVPVKGELVYQTLDDNYLATTTHTANAAIVAVFDGSLVTTTDCINFVKTGNTVYLQSAANGSSSHFPCFDAANPGPVGTNTISSMDAVYFQAHPVTPGASGLIVAPINGAVTIASVNMIGGTAGEALLFSNTTHSSAQSSQIAATYAGGYPQFSFYEDYELTGWNGHHMYAQYTEINNVLAWYGDAGKQIFGVKFDKVGSPYAFVGFQSAAGLLGDFRLFEGNSTGYADLQASVSSTTRTFIFPATGGTLMTISGTPTVNAGACWKTATTIGWCGAGQCGTVCN